MFTGQQDAVTALHVSQKQSHFILLVYSSLCILLFSYFQNTIIAWEPTNNRIVVLFSERIKHKYLRRHFQRSLSVTFGQGWSKSVQVGKWWKCSCKMMFYFFFNALRRGWPHQKRFLTYLEFMGWEDTTVTPISHAGTNLHPQDSHVYPGSPVDALLLAFAGIILLLKELSNKDYKTHKKVWNHGRFLPVFTKPFRTPR